MSVFPKSFFKAGIFSKFLKLALATSNILHEFYNDGVSQYFTALMLQEISKLVQTHVNGKLMENSNHFTELN